MLAVTYSRGLDVSPGASAQCSRTQRYENQPLHKVSVDDCRDGGLPKAHDCTVPISSCVRPSRQAPALRRHLCLGQHPRHV